MNYSALIPNGRDQGMLNTCLVSVLTQSVKPSEIIIFDDTTGRDFDRAILKMLDFLKIPCKVIRDVTINSMFAIREKLVKESSVDSEYCLFVDDDMVLDYDVVEKLSEPHFKKSKIPIAFTQGLRLEVGGRENNSPGDINQVRQNTVSGTPIYYGDTAILFFNRKVFVEKVPWDKIRDLMDSPNLGGSDVVITMSVVDSGYLGIAVPEAVGYHFAESNFSYWAGFSTADLYVQRGTASFLSAEILNKVYNSK